MICTVVSMTSGSDIPAMLGAAPLCRFRHPLQGPIAGCRVNDLHQQPVCLQPRLPDGGFQLDLVVARYVRAVLMVESGSRPSAGRCDARRCNGFGHQQMQVAIDDQQPR